MSSLTARLENEAMTGIGLRTGQSASLPVETDATLAQLPPTTTDAADTGSMTMVDGGTRKVSFLRTVWADHVAGDYVKANDLRKEGKYKDSFLKGLVATLKAFGALIATSALGFVWGWFVSAPQSWDRSKDVQVLTGELDTDETDSQQGEPSGNRLSVVAEEDPVAGDGNDADDESSVGSDAELQARARELSTDDAPVAANAADDVDTAQVVVVSQTDVSGSGVATVVAAPDKKALKAAAKAAKAAAQEDAYFKAARATLKEITERAPSKLDIEKAKKQVAGSVGTMVKAARAASKANAENGDIGAHDKNVDATQIARKVAAQLTGEANSADDVLALHKAVKELADDKGGTRKFVQLQRVVMGEHYPTTLTGEVLRVINEQGLAATLSSHLKRDIQINHDGSVASAEEVAKNAMKNLQIAVRRGIFSADEAAGIRLALGVTFAKACESALIENLKTQDPTAAFAVYRNSLGAAVNKGLLTEDEANGIFENIQDNPDVIAAISDSAIRTIAAREDLSDEQLEQAVVGIAPEYLQENGEFVAGVVAGVKEIRTRKAEERRIAEEREAQQAAAEKELRKTNGRQALGAKMMDSYRAILARRSEIWEATKAEIAARGKQGLDAQNALMREFTERLDAVHTAQELYGQQQARYGELSDQYMQLSGQLSAIAKTQVTFPTITVQDGQVVIDYNQFVTMSVPDAWAHETALRQQIETAGLDASAKMASDEALSEGLRDVLPKLTEYSEIRGRQGQLSEQIKALRVQLRATYAQILAAWDRFQEYKGANFGKLTVGMTKPRQEVLNELEEAHKAVQAGIETFFTKVVDSKTVVRKEKPAPVVPQSADPLSALLLGSDEDSSLFNGAMPVPVLRASSDQIFGDEAVRPRANSVFGPAKGVPISLTPVDEADDLTASPLSATVDRKPKALVVNAGSHSARTSPRGLAVNTGSLLPFWTVPVSGMPGAATDVMAEEEVRIPVDVRKTRVLPGAVSVLPFAGAAHKEVPSPVLTEVDGTGDLLAGSGRTTPVAVDGDADLLGDDQVDGVQPILEARPQERDGADSDDEGIELGDE